MGSTFSGIIKSLALSLSYLFLLMGLEAVIFFSVPLELLDSEVNIQALLLCEYILLLLIVLLYQRKFSGRLLDNYKIKIKLRYILTVSILAVLVRIINDPIYRFDEIIGNENTLFRAEDLTVDSLGNFFLFLRVIIIASIIEELIFRKIILTYFIKSYRLTIFGVIISTLLFSFIHKDATAIITAFIFGLNACIVFLRFGIFYAILFHGTYNFIWYILNQTKKLYWDAIENLAFGYLYWTLVVTSLLLILIFFKPWLKYIKLMLALIEDSNKK